MGDAASVSSDLNLKLPQGTQPEAATGAVPWLKEQVGEASSIMASAVHASQAKLAP